MADLKEKLERYQVLSGWILFSASILFTAYLQFYNLGQLNIVQWDESRLAVNAAEMSLNGQWLVTSFENTPDLYNTKPPLMIWLQTLSIKVFGLNEFAIRFPAALSGFVCILMVGLILRRKTKNLRLSALGMMLLATSNGFIQLHGSITGDFDALLTLFILLAFDAFDQWTNESSKRHFYSFILWQSLAIMSKSAAGIIPFPIWFIILMLQKQRKSMLIMCLGLLVAILPFVGYTLLREAIAPGYLDAIWANDFHGRFSKALEGHTSEWHYYIVNLFTYRFSPFIWLLPLAVVGALFSRNVSYRYYSVSLIAYLLLLSLAKTRIHWYDMPVLPLTALVLTYFIQDINEKIKNKKYSLVLTAVVCIFLYAPSIEKYRFITYREGLILDLGHYELSTLMKEHKGNAQYLANWYDAEFYFYTKQHPNIRRGKLHDLKPQDTVLLGNLFKDSLPKYYRYQVLKETDNARTIVIQGKSDGL